MDEAEMLRALPSVQTVAAALYTNASLKAGARTRESVQIMAQSASWPNYEQGDFIAGRNFLPW
jgi:hypothetical protein